MSAGVAELADQPERAQPAWLISRAAVARARLSLAFGGYHVSTHPAMFKLIRCVDLNWNHFEEFPVWSEFYDFDELDEIVGWGVDRAWLMDQLSLTHSGSSHAAYPVLYTDPLPHRQRLYIRAGFATVDGLSLDGYTVNEGDYAVGIWAHGEEFVFNVTLPDFAIEDAARLAKSVGTSTERLFPMRFETSFRMPDGSPICGTFSPF